MKRLDCCAQDHGNFVGSKLHCIVCTTDTCGIKVAVLVYCH